MDKRDNELTQTARRQHGVFSRAQARASGFTRWAVDRRVESKRWDELDRHAYRVAVATAPTARQLLMAASLATGGVATRRSAAALHGLLPFPRQPEILVFGNRKPATTAVLHRTDTLPKGDIVTVAGIPATSPVRTVIDLGGSMPDDEFEDLVDRALFTNTVRRHRLLTRARALRAPRRPGAARLLRLLDVTSADMAKARSIAEARVLRALDKRKIPRPEVNYSIRVNGAIRTLDFAWPDVKVALEVDGYRWHAERSRFERDRPRHNDIVDEEWTRFVVTARAVEDDVDAALAPVLRTHERRTMQTASSLVGSVTSPNPHHRTEEEQ